MYPDYGTPPGGEDDSEEAWSEDEDGYQEA